MQYKLDKNFNLTFEETVTRSYYVTVTAVTVKLSLEYISTNNLSQKCLG